MRVPPRIFARAKWRNALLYWPARLFRFAKIPKRRRTDLHCPVSEQGMIDCLAILANTTIHEKGKEMKTLTAKDAKYGFGQLIDLARAAPVAVSKHGRPVVVVVAVEEFERLKALEAPTKVPTKKRDAN